MGGGYHVRAHRPGLAVRGGGDGPVLAADRGMGDRRSPAGGTTDRSVTSSDPTASSEPAEWTSAWASVASQRSRRAVRRPRLSGDPDRARYRVLDEPPGRLLRQRTDGELLQNPESRADPSPAVPDTRGGQRVDLFVHRVVLQPSTPTLRPGLPEPRRVRGTSIMKPNPARPPFGGKSRGSDGP